MNTELRYIEVSENIIAKMREYAEAIDNLRGVKTPDVLKRIAETVSRMDHRNGRIYETNDDSIDQLFRAMEWAESSHDMKSFLNMTMKRYVREFSKQWGK